MKVRYQMRNMIFETEVESPKEAVRFIAGLQAIFEADTACGRCSSAEIQLRVRQVDKGSYYELVCLMCEAFLPFHEYQDGLGLYVVRTGLANRGWKPAYRGGGAPDDAQVPPAGRKSAGR